MTKVTIKPLRTAPDGRVPEVRAAYRLLRGAHGTVSGLFDAVTILDDHRRSSNPNTKGRMTKDEIDIFRSAIVLASSGLDASMKRLVNDVARLLIGQPGSAANAQYQQYLKQEIATHQVASGLRDAIVSDDPKESLLSYYLAERTKASFQGSGDLKTRVRNTLRLPKSAVPDANVDNLDPFFVARNQIVHDLDYREPLGTSTARNHRSADAAAELCDRVFMVAADIAHAAADLVKAL